MLLDMDEQEILNRFKRQQNTRRTRFPELMGSSVQRLAHTSNQTSAAHTDKAQPFVKLSRNTAIIILLGICVLAIAGGYAVTKWRHTKAIKTPIGSGAIPGISITLYYPQNLPAGFVYNNDTKTLKTDVFYYSVSGPKKDIYYITQQPIPASFDFVAFNKKFATPDTFNTGAGTVTAGAVGPTMLGSIRTNKNTWIIINSSAEATLANLETVARSFELK